MNKSQPLLFTRVRVLLLIVLLSITAILGSSSYIIHEWNQKDDVDKLVINVFGKQRMLTQLTAKEATRIYSLFLSREAETSYQSDEVQQTKIILSKDNLREARDAFAQTLAGMHSGSLSLEEDRVDISKSIQKSNEYLSSLDALWADYSQAIDASSKPTGPAPKQRKPSSLSTTPT
jgi:hypothetical protein